MRTTACRPAGTWLSDRNLELYVRPRLRRTVSKPPVVWYALSSCSGSYLAYPHDLLDGLPGVTETI